MQIPEHEEHRNFSLRFDSGAEYGYRVELRRGQPRRLPSGRSEFAVPVEEQDLAFADFGDINTGSKRLYPALGIESNTTNQDAPGVSDRGRLGLMEHETGFASQLRWQSASRAKLGRGTGDPHVGNVLRSLISLTFTTCTVRRGA